MKKGTAKKNDLRERIRQDLLDQLESDGTVGEYYIDLVGDYMSMWDTKNELMEDIAARGAVVEYTSNTGVSNMKRNESIDQQLEHYHLDYDALGIALEALEEADAEMRNRFSPELNRRAGIYLSQLTGGRYAKVRLNREMEAGAEERDGVATRDVISLSRGTADQLWLAVRLAVCRLALHGDE